MSLTTILLIAVATVLYFLYSSIITKRNGALEALSGIDVQLKKRSNLIPNILTIAKKFMEHEKAIFTEITALRESVDKGYDEKNPTAVREHLQLSAELSSKMNGFMLRAENYPELKSSQNMLQAQQTYNEVEAQIAAARRFYNSAVTQMRNSIQIFPGNIIAKLIGVKDMPLYEADETSKAPVNAADIL